MNDYADTSRPWQQRNDEAEKAYRGFLAWRNLTGDRTMLRAYRTYVGNRYAAKAPDSFRSWHQEYDWPGRSRAWDRYRQNREDEAQLTARGERAKERGYTLADLESANMEVAMAAADLLKEKLADPSFAEMFMPQQAAPLFRAVNESFKILAAHRQLKEGDEEEDEGPLSPRVEEALAILFEDYEPEIPDEEEGSEGEG